MSTPLRCRLAKGRHSSTSFQVSQVRFGARDHHLRRAVFAAPGNPWPSGGGPSNFSRSILLYQASGCSLVVRTCCVHVWKLQHTIQEKTWQNNSKLHELAVLQTTLCWLSTFFYFPNLLYSASAIEEVARFLHASWRCLRSKVHGWGNLPTAQYPTKSNPTYPEPCEQPRPQ